MLQYPRVPDRLKLALAASQNSYVVDYVARQKLGGTSFAFFILKQLPILPPSTYAESFPIATLLDFVAPRVLELVYTAHDLAPLARDCGYDGPPFRWDEERRFDLRAELDAAYFQACLGPCDAWGSAPGESREDLARLRAHFSTPRDAATHILNSFPIVREKDEKAHGSYRTRDTILALYESLTTAHRTGTAWQSPLDPAPGAATKRLSPC
jgi:hypothetical protein